MVTETTDTVDLNEETTKPNASQALLENLSINKLSEQENYEIKKELINRDGFADMKRLRKDKKYLFPIKVKNTIINKGLIKKILLPKLEETYTKLKEPDTKLEDKLGNSEEKEILESCKTNGENYINEILTRKKVSNKELSNCAQIARGERFLFDATKEENKDKDQAYIELEVQQATDKFKTDFKAGLETEKIKDINIFDNQNFFVRRHIDHDADITIMSDILLQGKKVLDHYLNDKKIKYVISSSWLFDDEFNDFWMKEREIEGKKEIPNAIKMRKEWLANYGGKLPAMKEKGLEKRFIRRGNSSLNRALTKYKKEGKKLKEGGGYIDLVRLEDWKKEQKQENTD